MTFKLKRMKTNRLKVNELTGAALDWAVVMSLGDQHNRDFRYTTNPTRIYATQWAQDEGVVYSAAYNWVHGGPIIEREGISVGMTAGGVAWYAMAHSKPDFIYRADTPLIAAMRCYCCAKLGDEIDIPEELCQQQSN